MAAARLALVFFTRTVDFVSGSYTLNQNSTLSLVSLSLCVLCIMFLFGRYSARLVANQTMCG